MTQRTRCLAVVVWTVLGAGTLRAADEAILGSKILIKDPTSVEDGRQVRGSGKESGTSLPVVLPQPTAGATVTVVTMGSTPGTQTFALTGTWAALGSSGWKYLAGGTSPVKSVLLKRTASGTAQLKVLIKGNVGTDPLILVPPNTGAEAGIILDDGNGTRYCVRLGGAAGGVVKKNDATQFLLVASGTAPAIEVGCPTTTTTSTTLPGLDLHGADLSGADLHGANLSYANLSDATLSGADLSDANLTSANLTRANLGRICGTCSFCSLCGGRPGANLTNANLSGANLLDASLPGANLTNANLSSANLTGADLFGADLTGANLAGVDLSLTSLVRVHAVQLPVCPTALPPEWACIAGALVGPEAYLADVNLSDANLSSVNLVGVAFTNANLSYANLLLANLTNTNLGGANLTNANLTSATLTYASLGYANLSGANLTGATLGGSIGYTDLSGANFSGANLTGATLRYVNLSGANLTNANLTGANLTGVRWSETVCPDGTSSYTNASNPESCCAHLNGAAPLACSP